MVLNSNGLIKENGHLKTAISPFPSMFSTLTKINFKFTVTFILSSVNVFNLDILKICHLVKSEEWPAGEPEQLIVRYSMHCSW